MSIDVTTTEQQITASVSGGTVAVGVSGGVGPTGSQGPSGVVAVTAPITNSGSSTSANLGLSVGSGLQVAGGALAVAFTSTAFTSAVVAAAPAGGGLADAPSDGTFYARKNGAWADITSPANLQVRRGTAAEVAAITPLAGEPVWATDTKLLSVGDGSTAGGVLVGYPVKVWKHSNEGMGGTPFSLFSLSPQNSVWEISIRLKLGPAGSDYETNTSTDISLASSTGISTPVGHLIFINSTGAVQHKILGNSAITCAITGNGEFLRIDAFVTVNSSTGVVQLSATNSDWEGGIAADSIAIARRIA